MWPLRRRCRCFDAVATPFIYRCLEPRIAHPAAVGCFVWSCAGEEPQLQYSTRGGACVVGRCHQPHGLLGGAGERVRHWFLSSLRRSRSFSIPCPTATLCAACGHIVGALLLALARRPESSRGRLIGAWRSRGCLSVHARAYACASWWTGKARSIPRDELRSEALGCSSHLQRSLQLLRLLRCSCCGGPDSVCRTSPQRLC